MLQSSLVLLRQKNASTHLSVNLVGEELPVLGALGFGVITFGTATCIFCVLANTIVLFDIRRDIISSSSMSHRTDQLFHLTQTVIDFFLGVLIMPIHILLDSHVAGEWLFSTSLCRVWYAADVALCTAAIWNQYISCLDKYWCVTSPTSYTGKRRRSRIKQMFRVLCLLAFGIGSPVLFDCNLADNAIYAFYSTLGSFWVPMITLLVLSFRSYRFRNDLVKFNKEASRHVNAVQVAKEIIDHFHEPFSHFRHSTNSTKVTNTNTPVINRSPAIRPPVVKENAKRDIDADSLEESSSVSSADQIADQRVPLLLPLQSPSLISLKSEVNCHCEKMPDHRSFSSLILQKPSSPSKKPIGVAVRHLSARQSHNIVSRRDSICARPLFPIRKPKEVESSGKTTELYSLAENCERSASHEEFASVPCEDSNSEFNERRVRFEISSSHHSLPRKQSVIFENTANSEPKMVSTRCVVSSLSLRNIPISDDPIKQTKKLEKQSFSKVTDLQKHPSLNDVWSYPQLEEEESVEAEEGRPVRTNIRIDDDTDEQLSRRMFFRRLKTFIHSSLGATEDNIPFDVYWRTCNISEHFIYSTTLVLGCCWGPFFIMYALGLIFQIESSQRVIRLLLWFGYFNSALNPALVPILTRLYDL